MKMTRRKLAGFMAAPALLSGPAAAQAPAPAPPDASRASTEFQNAARQLATVKLPRSVEPAARFEA
jgi:polyisoprenoid-binding protein YceI